MGGTCQLVNHHIQAILSRRDLEGRKQSGVDDFWKGAQVMLKWKRQAKAFTQQLDTTVPDDDDGSSFKPVHQPPNGCLHRKEIIDNHLTILANDE